MNKSQTNMKTKFKKHFNGKNAGKLVLVLALMVLFNSDAMAAPNTQVTAVRKILVPAVSGIFGLIVIGAGMRAATKFSNNESKEGVAYIMGVIAAIVIWTLAVQNADALANLLPQA